MVLVASVAETLKYSTLSAAWEVVAAFSSFSKPLREVKCQARPVTEGASGEGRQGLDRCYDSPTLIKACQLWVADYQNEQHLQPPQK